MQLCRECNRCLSGLLTYSGKWVLTGFLATDHPVRHTEKGGHRRYAVGMCYFKDGPQGSGNRFMPISAYPLLKPSYNF